MSSSFFSCAYSSSTSPTTTTSSKRLQSQRLYADNKNSDDWTSSDSSIGQWASSDDDNNSNSINSNSDDDDDDDWQEALLQKQDGTFWSTFEPSSEQTTSSTASENTTATTLQNEEEESELWLETLRSISSEEVEFNLREADRADKARQMEEWGFDRETIRNTLDVAMDTSAETMDDVTGMQEYREKSFWDEVDMETVESHTLVDIDEETGEPVRNRMVYVDEHTCIGCTNCATVAQSTFFMHSEYGRARVFQQWGDSDETIQIAIETCPVDCIHYVPYDELVSLEQNRRHQVINFKGRLVSQAEFGITLSHKGGNGFTAPQRISGNSKLRCSNYPTRGCGDCPMYGVGRNPEYERKERERQTRSAKRKLAQQREREQKTAEL